MASMPQGTCALAQFAVIYSYKVKEEKREEVVGRAGNARYIGTRCPKYRILITQQWIAPAVR